MTVLAGLLLYGAQDAPVAVVEAHLTPAGDLEFNLLNTYPARITAWTIEFRLVKPDGSIARHGRQTTDIYIREGRLDSQGNTLADVHFLSQGRSPTLAVPGLFEALPVVTLVAIAFEDGTTWGDGDTVSRIFQRRQTERDARREILNELYDVRRTVRGPGVLEEAQRRLSVLASTGLDEMEWRSVSSTLESLLRQVVAGRATSDEAMQHLIDIIDGNYRAAVKHAIQRKGAL